MFATTFVVASLLSCITYWLARRPGVAMRWVKVVFSGIAAFAMLLCFVALLASVKPIFTLLWLLVFLGASGIQAMLERAIEGDSMPLKHQFARTLLSYSSTGLIGYLMLAVVIALIARSGPTSSVWAWDIMAGAYGFLAGLVIAPLSISFFRRMFQTLPLRPGMDRMLSEEELKA
ncbi:MAG: hypothetical protein EOO38_18245 [Cytophagaceae bacterium]|nr:MAG: hypothetical protein EOO38_18245 [Cytophagaceae bacterium]